MTRLPLSSEDILARLVAFDTTSTKSNLDLISWVEDYLSDLGVTGVRVPDPTQDKASLVVTAGPAERGGVCLSGHTDVVPVAGQTWTTDPFTLTARDGKLYGRGTCDMKGFLAVCLAKLPDMLAANLTTPIHVILSYDEEITCEGVVHAIQRFGQDLPMPRACIVGEPTSMQVADAHKAVAGYVTTIKGLEAHSSNPDAGASALIAGTRFVAALDRLAHRFRERGDASGRFDVAYSTIHVGQFQSGTARNIIPNAARIVWECRGLPDLDLSEVERAAQEAIDTEVLPYLHSADPTATAETRVDFAIPGLRPEPGSVAETLALRLARANHTITVGYGTEGGQFQKVGIPTVVCGPGSIEQAHKPDEWIAVSELRRCEAFIDDLIEACRTGL